MLHDAASMCFTILRRSMKVALPAVFRENLRLPNDLMVENQQKICEDMRTWPGFTLLVSLITTPGKQLRKHLVQNYFKKF